jgi:biopolymer transport protein ExbB
MFKSLRIAIMPMLLVPAVAHAWWNDDWDFRKQLTLDTSVTGADVKGAVSNAPVLVRLHTGNFPYFTDAKPDGSDIRFVAADDKTPLKFHVEAYDSANEIALIWVKVPSIAGNSSSEKIWMYYGNAEAPAGQDAAGTWDTPQALVYHFDNATGAPQDRTAYGNHARAANAVYNPASLIGGGARFTGDNSITVGSSPSLRMTPDQGYTFAAWIKLDGPQQDAALLYSRDGDSALTFGVREARLFARYRNAQGKVFEIPADGTLNAGVWNHVALTLGAGRIAIYINGNETAAANATLTEKGGDLVLGSTGDANYFVGEMDEVQIANVARSADWIKIAARGQGAEASLLHYADDEQNKSGGGTSYFSVILQNVTVDGWVVIVLLAVMAAISWIVMIGKGLVITRVRKDNRTFLEQFKRLGARDPDALDANDSAEDKELENSPLSQALFGKHDHFQSSALYHIYHTGIQELHHRVGRAAGAQAAGLSHQSVDAIRAALDAAVVRETQKLNGQMVLLTIAISGGPFLGLLGTVVGVMITFAAIAASGDVNINAIAPGIAAALVATVAGLAVAIPALFGYNYLLSRIKECVADMHVFVDEFVTKLAEHYGR